MVMVVMVLVVLVIVVAVILSRGVMEHRPPSAPRHRLSGSNQMAAQRKPKDSGGCLYNCSNPKGGDISSLQSPPIVFLIAILKMSYLCICAPRERKGKRG